MATVLWIMAFFDLLFFSASQKKSHKYFVNCRRYNQDHSFYYGGAGGSGGAGAAATLLRNKKHANGGSGGAGASAAAANPLHAPSAECPGWDGGDGGGAGAGAGAGAGGAVGVGGACALEGGGADAAIPVHLFHKHVSELHMDQVSFTTHIRL